MKITQLFLCVIVFCCIAVSKSTASMLTASTLTTSMSQAALLKKHYYENHPRLFKEFEHQGKKIIVNKIANMPEIFNCGTPVDEGRIIKLTEAINTLFLNVEATFHSIKAFKKEYFGYSDEADEIVRSDISINTVRDMRAKLKDFDPITVNDILPGVFIELCQLPHLNTLFLTYLGSKYQAEKWSVPNFVWALSICL